MSAKELQKSLSEYENQLKQVELAIETTNVINERDDLINLRDNLNQLISLTKESIATLEQKHEHDKNKFGSTSMDDEYAMFMAEMAEAGAVNQEPKEECNESEQDIETAFKSLENVKCQAPYNHQLSGITYHNALVCGVISEEGQSFEEIKVRVMFTNPIYQEMLPCPYFLESECKFSDEKCRFSHGEIVLLESLKEYKEPNFMSMKSSDRVLVKLPTSKLWQLASIIAINDNQTCTIRTDMNKQEYDVHFENIFPLDNERNVDDSSSDSDSDFEQPNYADYDQDTVEKSLNNAPTSQALGSWEKYTKGIGSKLLQKMGYVVGTGLGLNSDGRIEPVDAVLLPTGKSLDHCMEIREKAGGDSNFFKVEKKLQRLQKKQEERNKKAYEREKAKTDVFTFLNDTLKHKHNQNSSKNDPSKGNFSQSKHRRSLQSETLKDLNVSGMKIEEDIKRCEHDLYKINESLTRYSDKNSVMNKNLKARLMAKQIELDNLRACERNIQNEQCLRKDKKKLTIF